MRLHRLTCVVRECAHRWLFLLCLLGHCAKCFSQVLSRVNEGGDAEQRKRAMQDPEIQAILQDPVMMSMLREMQENPSTMQKYMKDPKIRSNIEKLVAAGIVSTSARSQRGPVGGRRGGPMDEDE